MLKIINTENLTGITVSGTHDDLFEIYEAISNVLGHEDVLDLTSLRILGVCYDLRHCFMGDREIELVDNGFHKELGKYHGVIYPKSNVHFSVSILWLEAMFMVLALDDYVKCYENDKIFNKMMGKSGMDDDQKQFYALTRFEDIALVRLFQEKVWKAFREACGDAAYKKLYKKAKASDYHYVVVCKYENYCTHYLDTLEMKYIHSKRESREKLLATLVKKIIEPGDDYYNLAREVSHYAIENKISKDQVRLGDVEYPDNIKW